MIVINHVYKWIFPASLTTKMIKSNRIVNKTLQKKWVHKKKQMQMIEYSVPYLQLLI